MKATCLLFVLLGAAAYFQSHTALTDFLVSDNGDKTAVMEPTPISCKAIYLEKPQAYEPGVYLIQPNGHPQPFNVSCTVFGYTLLMKVDGSKNTFNYSNALWTNSETYNEEYYNLDRNETKLASFSTVGFTELYLRLVTSNETREMIIHHSGITLMDLLKDGKYTELTMGRDAWLDLVPGSYLQDNCNREGFNVVSPCCHKVRIGIIANNEDDCNTADSWVGIGGENVLVNTCGSSSNYTETNNVLSFAYVFGR